MKPFSRVVVIDDQQKHLDIIIRALGRAGFGAIGYHTDAGIINPPPSPCNGVRLVFSDIHLTPMSAISGVDNVGILGPFLKDVVQDGPYGLILWSKNAHDEEEIVQNLIDRADDLGIQLPVFFGFIDKKNVLTGFDDYAEEVDDDNQEIFKNLIFSEIEKCPILKAVMEWEERAFLAANFATNSLFKLSRDPNTTVQNERWLELISYLAQEAIGRTAAKNDPFKALDNALLPIVEDQLRYSLPDPSANAIKIIKDKLDEQKRLSLPSGVSTAKLHSFYLVENLEKNNTQHHFRGTVSTIKPDDFDNFIATCFASKWRSLLFDEFIVPGKDRVISDEARKDVKLLEHVVPCLISLTPECDDVQGKVVTQRYLLGVLADRDYHRFIFDNGNLARDALHRIGIIDHDGKEKMLVASCRRFLAIPSSAAKNLPFEATMRLRRATIEELSHHYTTYTRRPGVMRFS
ncbi:hypothetical protein [Pseudomonas sp. 5P_5.1_Bac1]|uniref:hypothetical protein n=1 Tax=Pseudomonas sp. 5P_5.1_Bac1 TaxID=2971616 RepID=UPI0021C95DA2|nr:hypothetical protein [Pseudomonas sp. 5P_5.1_Bac1]MCU1720225.1 hypothetical protein [Pseudomonas sp. 5P_5.1_Bac1]